MYSLQPAHYDSQFFFRLDKEAAKRYGAIGYMRADFGKTGNGFWSLWFDVQAELKTPAFQQELDSVINGLRKDGQNPPFANRASLERYCDSNPGLVIEGRGSCYIVQTQAYTYCFRCTPNPCDYEIYCFVYENSRFIPSMEKRGD